MAIAEPAEVAPFRDRRDGIVWYNESFQRPDAWCVSIPTPRWLGGPSGDIHAGHIRHMRSTREGN